MNKTEKIIWTIGMVIIVVSDVLVQFREALEIFKMHSYIITGISTVALISRTVWTQLKSKGVL